MAPPISVQLYSLREQTKDGGHLAVFKKLADTGFCGVEAAGFYGLKAAEYRTVLRDHGLAVSGNHFGSLPEAKDLQALIDTQHDLGCPYAISAWLPHEEYATVDGIKRLAERVEATRAALAKAGISLLLHNHDWEFARRQGRTGFSWLAELVPAIQFEIDTYWAANFGAEIPAAQVAELKSRAVLLHLKDGPLAKDQPMVAVGTGKQDIPAILKAADPAVLRWGVVELDQCATDMTTAVVESYNYLVGNGLCVGNKPAAASAKR
jgi:sugar phosphate isomerase/epimerase